MCSTTRCSRCNKTTWRGCGEHVDTVMGSVPTDQRCTCPPPERRSLMQRLGRG